MNNKPTRWATDLDIDFASKGEVYDIDVINRSIELILSTSYGERLFNPTFGSNLQNRLFEGLTEANCENILDEVISDIKRWENRIIILDNECRMSVNMEQHTVLLYIKYVVKNYNLSGLFKKQITII